jgi:hypothetical protein
MELDWFAFHILSIPDTCAIVNGRILISFYLSPFGGVEYQNGVDTPKIRAVSKFTKYDAKKIHPEVQDQSGHGSLEGEA